MSVIVGLLDRQRQPLDPVAIRGPLADVALPGTAHEGFATSAHASVGVKTRHRCHQGAIACLNAEDVMVVFDGQIDNRDELLPKLIDTASPAIGDAELAARAYVQWGPQMVSSLVGPFALILWDGRNQLLICARDAFGLRPLFYRCTAKVVVVASQLDLVRRWGQASDRIDTAYVADYFVAGKGRSGSTPFRDIRSVPAAHYLLVEEGRMTLVRHWDLQEQKTLRHAAPAEYAAEFRDLFCKGLRCALRDRRVVWSDLSGGLDSSAVVGVVARERLADVQFATLSLVFNTATESDESLWSQAVAQHHGVVNHQIIGEECMAPHSLLEAGRHWDEPTLEIFVYLLHRRIGELLIENGVDSYLKGLGAEYVVLSADAPPYHLAELCRSLSFRRLAKELREWQNALRVPLWSLVYQYCIRPLLPVKPVGLPPWEGVPRWLDKKFVQAEHVHERAFGGWSEERFHSAGHQWQYEQIRRCDGILSAGCLHKASDIVLPFLYRPLVEYVMRLPWEVRVSPGVTKPLLRAAFKADLPEVIRTRARKVTGNAAMYLCLARRWQECAMLLEDSVLEGNGIVDGALLRRQSMLAQQGMCGFLPGVLRPFALEAWLRTRVV